jgi:nitroreductase
MTSHPVRRRSMLAPDSRPPTLDRRRFLILAGGAAAAVVLRPHLAWARRVRSALPVLQPWSLPAEAPVNPIELTRALIGAAVLAPSNWNSQPWRFEAEGSTIRLVADTERTLPATDPDQRWMMMSLGAALENLLVAARAYGLRCTVTQFPHGGAGHVVAEVNYAMGESRRDRTMFAAITERRTNRREYDGRGVFLQNRGQLLAQIPEDFRLYWRDDREAMRRIGDLAFESVRERVRDRRAQAEQYSWMRFGDDEAQQRGDGVSVSALDIGGPARWLAGRYFRPGSAFLRFGAESAAKQARAQMRSCGAVALLTTSRGGDAQWLAAGQAFERLALKATALGIAQHAVTEPIASEATRNEVLHRFQAFGEQPLALLRLGHAKAPEPSIRRSVSLVTSFRSS